MARDNHLFPQPRHMANARPIQRPARAEIVRRGRVVATVYPRQGEGLDELQSRAQRMSDAYAGEVVIHEA